MSDIYRLPPRPPSSTPGRHRASGRKCSAGFGVKYESSRRDPEDYFNPNRERRLIVSYWSSWQRISIFEPFNPWKLLGLHSSQAPFGEVKAAFKRSITQSIPQQRVLVSLGYHIITYLIRRKVQASSRHGRVRRKKTGPLFPRCMWPCRGAFTCDQWQTVSCGR